MTPKARRRLRIVLLLGVAVLLSSCMFMPDFPRIYKSGKYDPVEETPAARPSATAGTPVAEKQTEPHTCGWHAMRSMYAAYGYDGDAFNLRFRLGTDEPAMRAGKDSIGTLHPDLYRVLAQDGFATTPLDLEDSKAANSLGDHLSAKQLALAVVYRSTYHWVLLGPSDRPDALVVYDSLKDEPVLMANDAFLDEALSITLVEANHGEPMPSSAAHAEGLAEMSRLYGRKE